MSGWLDDNVNIVELYWLLLLLLIDAAVNNLFCLKLIETELVFEGGRLIGLIAAVSVVGYIYVSRLNFES